MPAAITGYGGVGETGGSKFLIEDSDTRIFFDLRPRATRGLWDLLHLGLIPPLNGLYREDLTIPQLWRRFSPHRFYRDLRRKDGRPAVDAVLVSHSHLDHNGDVSFMDRHMPLYCTKTTAFIARAMQVTGKSDFERELIYINPRSPRETGEMSMHDSEDWRNQLEGKTIHIVFYCHADWQWEQSRRWHEERYALVVREVLDWMKRTDDLSMVIDNINEFLDPVWERLTVGEREEFRRRVREGRIGVALAGIANGRSTHIGDETFIRNLVMGRQHFAELLPQADLGVFQSVDISIGHSQLPQILTQAGFDAYRAWRPEGAMDAGSVPRQFLWQGLDGSSILVLRGPYGGLHLSRQLLTVGPDWERTAASFYHQVLAPQLADGRTPTSHLMVYIGNDDGRPFRTGDGDVPFDLPGFLAEWRRRETVPVRFDCPCDVRDAVLIERDKLPTIKGILDAAECGYNMSWAGKEGLWQWRTSNDLALVEAERWASLAWWHGAEYPQDQLKALWRDHLTYQPHAQEAAFAEDFQELVETAQHVRHESHRIARRVRRYLMCMLGEADCSTNYVFNPHSWPIETFVEVYHACTTPTAQSLTVSDDAGNLLPSQVVAELRHPRFGGAINDSRLLVKVKVPAGGVTRVHVEESSEAPAVAAAAPPAALEAGGLHLQFEDDALHQVWVPDKGLRYFNPSGGPWPCLTFHAAGDVGWYGPRLDRERIDWQPEESDWLEVGPHRWCHRARGSLAHFDAELLTYAWKDEPRLDFSVHLLDTAGGKGPAGFTTLRFPLPTDGRLWADIPFGIEERDPLRDRYMDRPGPGGDASVMFERPRTNLFWARSWLHWAEEGHSLTLISADGGIYYLYERGYLAHVLGRWIQPTPGTWEERAWGERAPGSTRQSFSYSLLFDERERPGRDIARFAALRRMPLTVEQSPLAPEAARQELRGLCIEGPAVVSASYVEDGACFVRLYECEGLGGEVTCRLPGEAASVMPVDLLGDRLTGIELAHRGDSVKAQLRPWQILTLRFDRTE